jgi:signal transduction histidine kinase
MRIGSREQSRAKQDILVTQAVQAIAKAPDLAQAFSAFCDVVRTESPFDRAGFIIRLDERQFRVLATVGPEAWRIPPGRILTVDGNERWRRFEAGRSFVRYDLAVEDIDEIDFVMLAVGIRSYVTMPVVVLGEVRALISFLSAHPNGIAPESVPVFEALVRETAATFNMLLLLEREREAVARLRALDSLKNEFVGTIAHDLRSPMLVIGNFARMVRDEPDLPEEQRVVLLDRIITNVDRLSKLVTDVLDVAQIESGDFEYDSKPFDLVDLCRRTLAETATLQPLRPCSLELPSGELPPAFGDKDRYWRVITNLLSNAFKFSPETAPVTVRVHQGDEGLHVEVRDSGAGIEPAGVARLFRKFSRLRNTEGGTDVPGTGLGLYICRQFVEAQGGQIWVESARGEGATFHFTVPAADWPAGREAAHEPVG